jgi:low affinity Fe/Cu permease
MSKTRKERKAKVGFLENAALSATRWSGSSVAILLAAGTIFVWLGVGPFVGFSDTWQLVINTGTTIVTFLMVFLIQRAQNKESQVVQLKLNEIVAALEGASNRLINAESLGEADVETLHRHYDHLAHLAQKEGSLTHSHSIEEAESRHKKHKK